jgi:hypothetical protein
MERLSQGLIDERRQMNRFRTESMRTGGGPAPQEPRLDDPDTNPMGIAAYRRYCAFFYCFNTLFSPPPHPTILSMHLAA